MSSDVIAEITYDEYKSEYDTEETFEFYVDNDLLYSVFQVTTKCSKCLFSVHYYQLKIKADCYCYDVDQVDKNFFTICLCDDNTIKCYEHNDEFTICEGCRNSMVRNLIK